MMSLKEQIQKLLSSAQTHEEQKKIIRSLRSNKNLYDEVVKATSFLEYSNVTFTTRLHYILFDKTTVATCACCGSPLLRNCDLEGKTLRYCSRQCSATHGVTKTKQTKLERYGSESYMNPDKVRETWNNKSREELSRIDSQRKSTLLLTYGSETYNNHEKAVETSLRLYGETNPAKSQIVKDRCHATVLERYGVDNVMYNSEIKDKFLDTVHSRTPERQQEINRTREETCLEIYGVKYASMNDDIRRKNSESHRTRTPDQIQLSNKLRESTCIEKYGVAHVMQAASVKEQSAQTCLEKYGMPFPPNSKFRRTIYEYDGLTFDSSYELYYYIWAAETGHKIKRSSNVYEFDVEGHTHYYFPDFTVDDIDVEIKGEHFFDDSGNLINPFTDDSHVQAVFHAKGECMKNNGITIITNIEEQKQYVDAKYTTDFVPLFRTDLPFPYLNDPLKNTSSSGLIQHFHKSIYSANRCGYSSPKDAWNDKSLILRSALNRLKYVKTCRPRDVLQGFNVAKIAPKVSVFSPTLAQELIMKYIDEPTIVDPFSGFSGRLLGAYACNKNYFGFDLNPTHVEESNNIIRYLMSDNISVEQRDLFNTSSEVFDSAALFTCPPYSDKECWNGAADKVLTCDEWIEECLSRYDCSTYLFVVDKTEKFNYNIVDTIENKSHFGTNNEYVVLIRKGVDKK